MRRWSTLTRHITALTRRDAIYFYSDDHLLKRRPVASSARALGPNSQKTRSTSNQSLDTQLKKNGSQTKFVSAIWPVVPGEEDIAITFGTDSSLTVTPGCSKKCVLATPKIHGCKQGA